MTSPSFRPQGRPKSTIPDASNRLALAGFSLVEVVLAVGVAAFAIVAIMGMLSVSLTNSRESANDTLVVNMANRVLTGLRQQQFSNLCPSTGSVTNTSYFDDLGMLLAASNGSGFVCRVVMEADAATMSPDTNLANADRVNLLRLRLLFSSAGRSGTSKIIHSSIARY